MALSDIFTSISKLVTGTHPPVVGGIAGKSVEPNTAQMGETSNRRVEWLSSRVQLQ